MPRLKMEDPTPAVVEQGVNEYEQTMTLATVFWSNCSPNLTLTTWVLGMLVSVIGLGFWTGLVVIIVGNLLGTLPTAIVALIGPKTGLTQIEASRYPLGRIGVRAPAFINWVTSIGFDAINNVPSAAALVALFALFGFSVPFVVTLAFLAIVQMIAAIYGHDLVQLVEKYLGYFLFVVFVLTGAAILFRGSFVVTTGSNPGIGSIILATSLIASFNFSLAPYSADYTRYLPKNTPWQATVGLTYIGLVFSAVSIETLGLITASAIADPSPIAVIQEIGDIVGPLAPLTLAALGLAAIAPNSMNDNTAAYSLISAGIHVSRPVSAVIASILSFAMAAIGSGKYATLYENYLLVTFYWLAPWVAIILVHWFASDQEMPETVPGGWTKAATIFVGVTLVTGFLFSATPAYTGPIGRLLGGVDIGYIVGFILTALLYGMTLKRKRPRHRV
ncbi:MAG: cytosine permease [Elainellaceae cyanobacterium]